MKQLWKDIQLIYEYSKKKSYVNLNITSQDNFYSIECQGDKQDIHLCIKKEYNLINMWNGLDGPDHSYELSISIQDYDENGQSVAYLLQGEQLSIERAYDILKPYIREAKISRIGI
jgi:hypothetical protein